MDEKLSLFDENRDKEIKMENTKTFDKSNLYFIL